MRPTLKTTKTDRVLRQIVRKVGEIGKAKVKVGWLDDGQAHKNKTMAEIAAIHEFGAPNANIPAREPLRRTFTESEGREETRRMSARVAKAVVTNKMGADQALNIMGEWAVNSVKRRIKMGLWPPLKPATVQRKGSSTTLIDTGQLVNATSFVVVR